MRSIKFLVPDNGRDVIFSCTVVVRDPETGAIAVNQGGQYISGKDAYLINEVGAFIPMAQNDKKKKAKSKA